MRALHGGASARPGPAWEPLLAELDAQTKDDPKLSLLGMIDEDHLLSRILLRFSAS
jgi:hypothetical protein